MIIQPAWSGKMKLESGRSPGILKASMSGDLVPCVCPSVANVSIVTRVRTGRRKSRMFLNLIFFIRVPSNVLEFDWMFLNVLESDFHEFSCT